MTKTRHFTKKSSSFIIKIIIFSHGFKKTIIFPNFNRKSSFWKTYFVFQKVDFVVYFGFLIVFLKPQPSFDRFHWNHSWFQQFFFYEIFQILLEIVVSWPKFGPKMTKKEVSKSQKVSQLFFHPKTFIVRMDGWMDGW